MFLKIFLYYICYNYPSPFVLAHSLSLPSPLPSSALYVELDLPSPLLSPALYGEVDLASSLPNPAVYMEVDIASSLSTPAMYVEVDLASSLPTPAVYVEVDPLDLELMLPHGDSLVPVDDLIDCILKSDPDLATRNYFWSQRTCP